MICSFHLQIDNGNTSVLLRLPSLIGPGTILRRLHGHDMHMLRASGNPLHDVKNRAPSVRVAIDLDDEEISFDRSDIRIQ